MKWEKQFVTAKQSIELEKLGFVEYHNFSSYQYYGKSRGYVLIHSIYPSILENGIKAPLYQQAFDWFREKHSMPNWVYESTGDWWYRIVKGDYWIEDIIKFNTFEEARDALLNKLIESVKI